MKLFSDLYEFIKPILLGLVIIFLLAFFLSKCESWTSEDVTPVTTINQKELIKEIDSLQEENKQIDSSTFYINKRLKTDSANLAIQMNRYKSKYTKALSKIPDTLKIYIKEMDAESSRKDSIFATSSARKDSIISEKTKQNENLNSISSKKDSINAAKSDSIAFLRKLIKRKYWRGFSDGVIVGSVGTGLILGGANTIRKN